MSKRGASRELTHDNWEVEDEQEEMGTFRQASVDALAGRNIKKAKRRGTNGDSSSPSVFKGLSVFSSFGAAADTPTFSFLNNVSKSSSESSSSKGFAGFANDTALEKINSPIKKSRDPVSSTESKSNGFLESKNSQVTTDKSNSVFLTNLKSLNEGVLVWIKKHLDKDIHVNLSPVFDDYKKHFAELVKKYPPELSNGKESDSGASESDEKKDINDKENTSSLKGDSKENIMKPFTFGIQKSGADKSSDTKPVFSFGGAGSSEATKKTESTITAAAAAPFSFTKTKPEGSLFGNTSSSSGLMFGGKTSSEASKGSISGGFSFSAASSTTTTTTAAATAAAEKTNATSAEEESDEPPKVEVNEVKEEDALYEKKCKLFYMKEGAYVDRGVGTVFLKSVEEKTQLLVRAYTNLGNILLNIILNSSVPTVRAGKNGVMLVCVPNPPLETNAEKSKEPIKMLIRVKTSEDADTLLEKINEYKK